MLCGYIKKKHMIKLENYIITLYNKTKKLENIINNQKNNIRKLEEENKEINNKLKECQIRIVDEIIDNIDLTNENGSYSNEIQELKDENEFENIFNNMKINELKEQIKELKREVKYLEKYGPRIIKEVN